MDTPIEELTFEDALKELERIVGRLESGEATLDAEWRSPGSTGAASFPRAKKRDATSLFGRRRGSAPGLEYDRD